MRYPTLLHAPDDGDDPQGGESPRKPRPSDLAAQYHNDAMRISERLSDALDDNFKLREKNRALTTDLAALKSKMPADDAVLLSKDDAALWEAYKALGAPAELKQQVEAATDATTKLAALQRNEAFRVAAEAQGYRAGTLAKLPSLAGKDLIVKDVEADGKPTKAAFVVADGKEYPLSDYITANDPEFLPALTADVAKPSGTPYVRQNVGGAVNPLETFGKHFQEARDAAPNPLAPRAASKPL